MGIGGDFLDRPPPETLVSRRPVAAPSLTDIEGGDLKVGVDFRRVYAAALEGWPGLPSEPTLGRAFEPQPLFRA